MHEGLIDFLNTYVELEKEEVKFIEDHVPVHDFKKGDFLLKTGEVSGEFYFILEGSARLYYDVGIEERTAFFYFENEFVSSYESFTQQIPAKHNLQCLEDTRVAEISIETSMVLLERFPNFEFLARVLMEKELSICQDIIAAFITLSPEERYLQLMDKNPELIERIPQYYLASYIGVRPESLSRIRKRIVS